MKSNRNDRAEAVITADEIKLILDRYRIGKKPLAKLLGWGETTIIRYMEGDIPTSEYSSKLKKLLTDPEYYYEVLCKRRDCLTGVAFKKSKKAVMSRIMASKIYSAAFYMVNKSCAEMCASYIQYLLYYAQGFSLALFDRELFPEEYSVNNDHLPYIKLYEGMKCNGIHMLEGVEEYLTAEEMGLLDEIMESFLWYGPKALCVMTDGEKAIMKISRDKSGNKIITKDAMKTYFKEVLNRYQIKSLKDVSRYPHQKIIDITEINVD